jgi:hypothetical protein
MIMSSKDKYDTCLKDVAMPYQVSDVSDKRHTLSTLFTCTPTPLHCHHGQLNSQVTCQ